MTPTEQIRRAQEVFDVEIEGLRRTRAALGDAFTRTVALMLACVEAGGKVVVTGVGKSLHVAEKTSAILASTGTCSVVLNPVQAMHGDLGMTGPKDLLLALSFSGESEELVRLVPAIRRHVSEGREVLGDAVSRHMTRHPLTIGGDAYAVDLLRVFESRQIDDLPVCAADGRLLGVVDIQDLPKMKVL